MCDRNQRSVDVLVEKEKRVNVDVLVGGCGYGWEFWVWLGVAMVVDVAAAVGVGVVVDGCGGGCGWVWVDVGGCRCACRCVWVGVGGWVTGVVFLGVCLFARCVHREPTYVPTKQKQQKTLQEPPDHPNQKLARRGDSTKKKWASKATAPSKQNTGQQKPPDQINNNYRAAIATGPKKNKQGITSHLTKRQNRASRVTSPNHTKNT